MRTTTQRKLTRRPSSRMIPILHSRMPIVRPIRLTKTMYSAAKTTSTQGELLPGVNGRWPVNEAGDHHGDQPVDTQGSESGAQTSDGSGAVRGESEPFADVAAGVRGAAPPPGPSSQDPLTLATSATIACRRMLISTTADAQRYARETYEIRTGNRIPPTLRTFPPRPRRRFMFTSSDEVLRYIADNDVKFVDVRFCDLPGVMQHFTVPVESFSEDTLRPTVWASTAPRSAASRRSTSRTCSCCPTPRRPCSTRSARTRRST